jgi:hypothetical protein
MRWRAKGRRGRRDHQGGAPSDRLGRGAHDRCQSRLRRYPRDPPRPRARGPRHRVVRGAGTAGGSGRLLRGARPTTDPGRGGECEFTRFAFREVFLRRAVDVAQPDTCAAGGLSECLKIAAMVIAHGISYMPHLWGTGVALAAALQLLAVLPHNPRAFIRSGRCSSSTAPSTRSARRSSPSRSSTRAAS